MAKLGRFLFASVLMATGLIATSTPTHAAPSPQISAGDASVHEGNTKNRSVLIPVTLTEPAAGVVTVSYVIAGVDATPGSATTANADFNAKNGQTKTLTFKAGQVQKFVTVTVYPDTIIEPDETFTLTLSNPNGGPALGKAVGVGKIIDDDISASNYVSVGDAMIEEGDTTKRSAKFRVTLTEPAANEVTVDYMIVPVTASGAYDRGALPPGTDLRDFGSQTKTAKIKAGAVQSTVTVLTYPDTRREGDETFQVVLNNVQGPATLGLGQAAIGTGTIEDDEIPLGPGPVVWAWGYNNQGQLGLIDNATRLSPTVVDAGADWESVDAGNYGTAGIKTDGTLWQWGFNPTQVGAATDWDSVAVGGGPSSASTSHAVAVKNNGTLWTWGSDNHGQLGLGGAFNTATSPTQVGASTDWASADAGTNNTLAIKTDGTLWAWGNNADGKLGLGDTVNRTTPTQVGTDTNWATVTVGDNRTLAIKTDGTLWAWGHNTFGQLGVGDTVSRMSPTQVGTDSDWAIASGASNHAIAIKTDGSLWAWGYNAVEQLGLGDTVNRTSPTQVGASTDWTTVAASNLFTLAIKSGGSLWAWGYNAVGQLGLGDIVDRTSPTQVGASTDWTAVTGGVGHAVAIRQ